MIVNVAAMKAATSLASLAEALKDTDACMYVHHREIRLLRN